MLLLLFSFFIPIVVLAEGEDLLKEAGSGILIEASTGTVIFEKNSHDKVAVASLTKMVAQILILENIESGNLKWDEIVSVSANAAGMGGTQIFLTAGEKMSVRDLFKGISMASANDATVAMAERIAGTEDAFVKLMNDKVRELGLKETTFKNCTGLDEEGHLSSAYDMALIAKELLDHEQILEFSSVYEDYLRADTPNKFWLVNTNKLVRFYEGADGLKTGFTDAAMYSMAVTAKRNNMRLIAVVLGEKVSKTRNAETTELLDYGFNLYKIDIIRRKVDVVDKIEIIKGSKKEISVFPKDDVSILSKKSEVSINYDVSTNINKIKLPIKKGDVVGKLILKNNNKILKEVDLMVNVDVNKIKYLSHLWNSFMDLVIG